MLRDGGRAVVVEPTGSETELVVDVGGEQFIVVTHGRPSLAPGDRIALGIDPAYAHVFDESGGQRIA